MFECISKEWWEGRVILDNCIANLLLLPGLMPYQGIKTQRHIFNWYYQSCVTKLDVGVFARQLLLSPSLIKFCSIYTLAWETGPAYYCFRTSNIITNYCNTCLIFWYLTSLLLNVLLGFEQKTSPLLGYNWKSGSATHLLLEVDRVFNAM